MFIHVILKQKSPHPNQQCNTIEGICKEWIGSTDSVVSLVQTLCKYCHKISAQCSSSSCGSGCGEYSYDTALYSPRLSWITSGWWIIIHFLTSWGYADVFPHFLWLMLCSWYLCADLLVLWDSINYCETVIGLCTVFR